MVISQREASAAATQPTDGVEEVDVIVIGAGVTGLYSLYRLRNLGFTAISFEEGDGVGGTWYWNRYPGARFDSESYTYGYSFSEELLQEWSGRSTTRAQPENERYLNYVADKFDLRPYIRFERRVASLVYDEAANRWTATTDDGYQARSQFVITAIGILSARYIPDFEGLESYEGVWTHTNRWPKEGIDMVGKKVGIIGTGATAVQLIPKSPKTSPISPSSSAPPTSASLCATPSLTTKPRPTSSPTTPKSSSSAWQPPAPSCICSIPVPPWTFPPKSAWNSTNACGPNRASRNGCPASTT